MRKHIDISRTIIILFDALKTKDSKIRGICNLLRKVKFHELEWGFPLSHTSYKMLLLISSAEWELLGNMT